MSRRRRAHLGTIGLVLLALGSVASADTPMPTNPTTAPSPKPTKASEPLVKRMTRWQPLQAPGHVHVNCTFLEIAATKSNKGSMDPGVKPIERKLARGPFRTWNDFKLLSKTDKTLAKKKTENIALKQGAATGTLVEIVDKSKARLTLTVDNAKGKRVIDTTITVDAADYVILTNELANGDGHLVAVTCK